MYAEYFKFKDLPFQLSPDPRFMFESSQHSRALSHLKFGLNQGEGFIVVTGEVGAGKTTIIQYLLSTLSPRQYTAATVVTTSLDDENMIRMITSGFGLKQEGRDKASILRDFEGFLADSVRRGKRALLFVDEAQNLSVPAIEELRMLSNIQIDGVAPLQLFLLGQPQFRRTMASDDLLQLRQRVIASYHLGPMTDDETRAYVLHRLNRAGWRNDPAFAEDAFPVIYRYTEGVPRRINNLCSRLLLYCYLEQSHAIDEAVVVAVAEDLEREFEQILERDPPPPGQAEEAAAAAKAVLKVDAPPRPKVEAQPLPPASPAPVPQVPVSHTVAPPPPPPEPAPSREHWREVVDIIESTPVDALASFTPEVRPERPTIVAESPAREKSQNQLFKRLLLLILEEYLKGRPEPRGP